MTSRSYKAPELLSQKPWMLKKIIDISELYPHEQSGFPLWGHSVAIFDFEYEGMLPFGKDTHNILIVSHPDGLIDMNSLSKGFIHLGWGMSLAVGISPQETAKSWRINDMINYFDSKKDALAHLHEQGEARLKESLEQKRNKMSDRLNILLSILALLTLFSWAADSIGFLDATLDMLPNLKPFLIGGKFVVIILTPILVIGIFLFFFRVTTAMEKLEE